MTVRVFLPDMLPMVLEFYALCFAALGWPAAELDTWTDLQHIPESYLRFWCLLEEQTLMGTIALRDIAPGTAEIKRWYVRPEAQGQGLGRRLMDLALAYARRQGFQTVRLDSSQNLRAARRLYRRYGFCEIPRYNDNAAADLFFELALSEPCG